MEFFMVNCPGLGSVAVDGSYQGDNRDDMELKVFQCNRGTHDISMECQDGKLCQESSKRVQLEDTNPIMPMEITFTCC